MNRHWYIFKNRTHARRFLCGLAMVALALMAKAEFWQPVFGKTTSVIGYSDFSCSNGQAIGNLFTSARIIDTLNTDDDSGDTITVTAPDPNYDGKGQLLLDDPTAGSGVCSTASQPAMGIFARMLCFFKSTIGQIMSTMYCGFQQVLRGPLRAAMTLFVVIYGIFVVTGMVEVNVKHIFKTALKMVLVLLFATHAEWGIGVGYRFFMTVAEGGATTVLAAMNNATGGDASLTQPDVLLYSLFNMVATGKGMGAAAATSGVLSKLHISSYCARSLAPLVFFMLLAVPPVAIFLVIMLLMYIGLYARAVLGYLTALVLITFLFVMAPIFLCFALFSITYKIFERWLQYLITYSLQMILVFAFLAMLQLVPIGTFMINTVALLKEYDTTFRIFFIKVPVHTCGICDITGIGAAGSSLLTSTNPPTCVPFQGGKLAPGDVMSTPDDPAVGGGGGAGGTGSPTGNVYPVIPLLNLLQRQEFVVFMLSQIIALWLIGYVMEDFLKKAPDIAKEIGAMPIALAMGGSSQPQAIGDNMASLNYPGMESIEAGFQGFKKEFTKDPMSILSWPRRIAAGVGGTVDGFLHGAANPDDAGALELEQQSQEIANYVADRQQKYVTAQGVARANTTALLKQQTPAAAQAMKNFEDLKASGADHSKLSEAYGHLTPAQKALVDYKDHKADPKTDKDALKTFYDRLNPVQQSYVNATENEQAIRQDLIEARDQQDKINKKLAPRMLAGIADTQTPDGVSRGPSSLMKRFLTQEQVRTNAGDTDDENE